MVREGREGLYCKARGSCLPGLAQVRHYPRHYAHVRACRRSPTAALPPAHSSSAVDPHEIEDCEDLLESYYLQARLAC